MSLFDIDAVIGDERLVRDAALRDVYVIGMWDALKEWMPELKYHARVAVIAKRISKSSSVVRPVVDRYEARMRDLAEVEKNQLRLDGDGEGEGV